MRCLRKLDLLAFYMAIFGDNRLPERFWRYVKIDEITGCWNWTASKHPRGYGVFSTWQGKKSRRAHRVIYAALILECLLDDIDDLICMHKCDNTSCCNPEHLLLGATQDNVNDKMKKGRFVGNGYQNKEYCINGHLYTKDNTFYTPYKNGNFHRGCKICRKIAHDASRKKYPRRKTPINYLRIEKAQLGGKNNFMVYDTRTNNILLRGSSIRAAKQFVRDYKLNHKGP